MGLPIWREPEEKTTSKCAAQQDPTACLRSSIRRRPSVHGQRIARLSREPTFPPRFPRFPRSPPPSNDLNESRIARRGEARGVPPISTLLEAANRDRAATPLPPVPEPRNYILPNNAATEQDWQEWEAQRRVEMRLQRLRSERRESDIRLARLLREHDRNIQEESLAAHNGPDGVLDGRRSNTPSSNRGHSSQSSNTNALDPGEPLRIIRVPGTGSNNSRPQSRNGAAPRLNTLPTPPLDHSGHEGDQDELSFSTDHSTSASPQRTHPLSQTWRASSLDGLGDRERSPPENGWDLIGTTITPDETLPSAASSFASTAASQSFNAPSSTSTPFMEQEEYSEGPYTDEDDAGCWNEAEEMAEDFYYQEMQTPEGRERIAAHQRRRGEGGDRWMVGIESNPVEMGSRLIVEALETEEGRQRLLRRGTRADLDLVGYNSWRTGRDQHSSSRTTGDDHSISRRSGDVEPHSSALETSAATEANADADATISHDAPQPHPVNPPDNNPTEPEDSGTLLDNAIQDLDSIRRIAERLTAPADIPEDWWMSTGLDLTRMRRRYRDGAVRRRSGDVPAALSNTRAGRVERGNARL